jgi:PST family polysaccharide transporter
MRRLVEAAVASGLASVIATVCGFARVKLYALFLGVAGVGVISQVQTVHNLLAVLAMMGLGIGISREVARARGAGQSAAVESVLATARIVAGAASFLLVASLLLLAVPLSTWLFGDPSHANLLRISAPALVFVTLGRVLHEVLNGHRAYWATSVSTLVASVLAVGLLAPLLAWRGLQGAAMALTAAAFVGWLVVAVVFRRTRPELTRTSSGARATVARSLLRLGAATLAIATAEQVVLVVIRARLIHWHGLVGNGWFQGVWGLSQYLLNVTVVFLTGYAVARINEMGGGDGMHTEVHRSVRMTLLLTVPMAAAMIVLREPLIRIFLSPEFLPAVPLFPYQAGGLFCRALGFPGRSGCTAGISPVRLGLRGPRLLPHPPPPGPALAAAGTPHGRGCGRASGGSGLVLRRFSGLVRRRRHASGCMAGALGDTGRRPPLATGTTAALKKRGRMPLAPGCRRLSSWFVERPQPVADQLDDPVGCLTVAKGVAGADHPLVIGPVLQQAGCGLQDVVRIRANEQGRSRRHGLGSLGGLAQNQHRLAQGGGFLLDPP